MITPKLFSHDFLPSEGHIAISWIGLDSSNFGRLVAKNELKSNSTIPKPSLIRANLNSELLGFVQVALAGQFTNYHP